MRINCQATERVAPYVNPTERGKTYGKQSSVARYFANFVDLATDREHQTVAIDSAMAAWVTDKVWMLREVLLFRVPPWPQEVAA